MKNRLRLMLIAGAVILLITAISVNASTVEKLSPALDHIAHANTMIKSGEKNSAVCFTTEDFLNHTGLEAPYIKVTSLPNESDGTLMLGSTSVSLGQKISWGNIDLLRFVANEGVTSCSFSFTTDSSYTTECMIKLPDSVGSAPVTEGGGIAAVTQSDISCHGMLGSSDADGDILMYEITSYPSSGLVSITDTKAGSFIYTPYEGFTGVDSFSYRVRDELGNYSDICQVSLEVIERDGTEVFADMDGHYAHSAALSAVDDGYMSCISENGILYFDPDENITRGEYLYAVMKALGSPELSPAVTVFTDDADISDEHSGYVNAAYKLGIIKGVEGEAGLTFAPNEYVTRTEAAVILNRILGVEGDGDKKSAWAEYHVSALTKLGIMSFPEGESELTVPLTRAEAAQMLFVTKNLYS